VDAGFSREFFDAATAGVLDEDAPVIGATGVLNRGLGRLGGAF
jgi:hypothetical protein